MTASDSEQTSARWSRRTTAHLLVYCAARSYAERMVDEIAERAEAAYQRGWEWFFGEQEQPSISVYLTDWIDDDERSGQIRTPTALAVPEHRLVWLLVSPESPGVGLEESVLELLARAAGAEPSERLTAVLNGLAGLISPGHGGGLTEAEADRLAHERHGKRRRSPGLFETGLPPVPGAPDPADVSFLLFLERTYGPAALARYAREALSLPPEAAIQAAYARPLAALRSEWLSALRARLRTGTSGRDVVRAALPLLRPHWRRQLEIMAYMALDLAFTLVIPLSTKYLFDDIIAAGAFDRLPVWTMVVLAVFAVSAVAGYRHSVVAGLVGELVQRDLRRAAFAHLQRLSLRYHTRVSSGDVLTRLTGDLDTIQDTLANALPGLIYQVVSLVVAAVILLSLNWLLGLLVLVLVAPTYSVMYLRASGSLREASRELQDRIGGFTSFLQEHLAAQPVVKTFGLETRARGRFDEILQGLFDGSMRLIRLGALLGSGAELVYLAVRIAVLAIGAALILNDRMTVGELVAFIGLIGQVMSPMTSIASQYKQLQATSGSFDRVQELLEEPPDIVEDPLAEELLPLEREIRLERVTFRYGDGQSALRGVSLTIPAGGRVAVVGPSGAGKSTLAALLPRLYDSGEGRVLFDGRDIRGVTLDSLRRQLAIVPQETFLFDGTIAENIALGREGADEAAITRAARAAALDGFIRETELGYATRVGERGVRLSGGQRQRLAIARALIRDPRVLILDEATSALDAETEAAIMATLDDVGRGRTMIMITHRLGSAAQCDWIVVLDHGALVEEGTHQELCARRGLYWRLYTEQQGMPLEWPAALVDPSVLARVPLFASLGPAALAAVARHASLEQFESGQVVVRQGEAATKLFIIGKGQVEVLLELPNREERRLATLGDWSYFGEIALLGDGPRPRTATVRALTPLELYSLDREHFVRLLRAQPHLAEQVQGLADTRAEQARAAVGAVGPSWKPPLRRACSS